MMLDDGRPGPAELLEKALLRYHVDELAEAIRDTYLGPGGVEELDENLASITRQLVQLEDMLARVETKLETAAKQPRWTLRIERWTVTLTRGGMP